MNLFAILAFFNNEQFKNFLIKKKEKKGSIQDILVKRETNGVFMFHVDM